MPIVRRVLAAPHYMVCVGAIIVFGSLFVLANGSRSEMRSCAKVHSPIGSPSPLSLQPPPGAVGQIPLAAP